jgi:hypothetical protein
VPEINNTGDGVDICSCTWFYTIWQMVRIFGLVPGVNNMANGLDILSGAWY